MSAAGEQWAAREVKHYGVGKGRTDWCVFFVACPSCGSGPGVLCTNGNGPNLARHWRRAAAYTQMRRRALRSVRVTR